MFYCNSASLQKVNAETKRQEKRERRLKQKQEQARQARAQVLLECILVCFYMCVCVYVCMLHITMYRIHHTYAQEEAELRKRKQKENPLSDPSLPASVRFEALSQKTSGKLGNNLFSCMLW